jgi:hypothetical protein
LENRGARRFVGKHAGKSVCVALGEVRIITRSSQELRAREDPSPSALIRARNIATAVSVGGLGVGPLIAGFLAEWASFPLTLPYLVFLGLGALALIGVATAPDTRRCCDDRPSLCPDVAAV